MTLVIAIASLTASPAWAGPTFDYYSFDVPAGTDSPIGNSYANGISNNGIIVGTYFTDDTVSHGYVLDHGVYTYIDAPGAGTSNYLGTDGVSINSSGQAIFASVNGNSASTSYLYSGGAFTPIVPPLAPPYSTFVESINDQGLATGFYERYDGGNGAVYSFVYNVATKTFSPLPEVPEADPKATFAYASASNGDFVAQYFDSKRDSMYHLAIEHAGVFTLLPDISGSTYTIPTGINSSDVVTGYYYDADGKIHGFENIGGTNYTIDYPGAAGTSLNGINDAGQAVGYWYEASDEAHSLIVSASVPEPSSLVTSGMAGLLGLGFYWRRRSTAA